MKIQDALNILGQVTDTYNTEPYTVNNINEVDAIIGFTINSSSILLNTPRYRNGI